jgi:hypothetical protein
MPLQPPPHDADGNIVPHDHPEIFAADILIRRISAQYITGQDGNRRISSMAFSCSSDGTGMSVDIAKLIEEVGSDPRAYVTNDTYFCSVQFTASSVREGDLQAGYYPLPSNPFHGAVWGITTRSQKNRLRRLAQWFVEGSGISLHSMV